MVLMGDKAPQMTEAGSGNFHLCTTAQLLLISKYGFTISSLGILAALLTPYPHTAGLCALKASPRGGRGGGRLCA